jgi:CelD/BcsL family acetyltransferase involved in cellulose biosynthesis
MQVAGFAVRERVWKTADAIELSGTWGEYLAARTSKFRNNLRRSEARAARHGEVVYQRYRPLGAAHNDGDPRWDLYDDCVALARRSWQGSSKHGTTLSHDSVREFVRDVHEAAARCGALDLNILRIDGRVAAYAYNYHYAGVLNGVRMGYDPEFARISPGTLLLARCVRDSFARGDLRIDLGIGPAPYKGRWRTRMLASWRYTHYASASPRGQLLRLKHRWWPSPRESGQRPPSARGRRVRENSGVSR